MGGRGRGCVAGQDKEEQEDEDEDEDYPADCCPRRLKLGDRVMARCTTTTTKGRQHCRFAAGRVTYKNNHKNVYNVEFAHNKATVKAVLARHIVKGGCARVPASFVSCVPV